MDYKEKLEEAKRLYESANADQRYVLESLFPELKESEDEKIRKDIIVLVKDWWDRVNKDNISTKEQMIAWLEKQGKIVDYYEDRLDECACKYFNKGYKQALEKQGEQEFNCDKLEKFVKGWRDKYSYPDDIDKFIGFAKSVIKWYQQNEQKQFDYEKAHIQQNDFVPKSALEAIKGEKLDNQNCIKPTDKVEPKFHEGDWLVHKDLVGVTYCITQIHAPHYYLTNNNSFIKFEEEDNYRPWTIQDAKDGDVLCLYYNNRKTFFIFKAIIGEGDYADILVHCCYTGKYQYLEPSFNGECRMHQISDGGYCLPADKEEQDILFQKMHEAGYMWDSESKQLLSLKAEPMVEQKPAWSEEDEMIALSIEQVMNCESLLNIVPEKIDKIRTWLKSLRPQSQWKPSDEQMKQLGWVVVQNKDNVVGKELMTLYNDLENLKGLRYESKKR